MTDPVHEDGLVQELRELEESLWRSETRFDRAHLERVLHPDFTEHGQSGRVWTRAESLEMEGGYEIDVVLPFPELSAELVAPGVALVTYLSRTSDGARMANRSSLWILGADGWQLRFHTGTPTTR